MWFRLASLTVVLMALVACGSEHDLRNHDNVDVWVQHDISAVDILFVVDDSHSMLEEQQSLSDGFQQFIDRIDEAAVDFHLGVISTSVDHDDPTAGLLIGSPPYLTADDDYVRGFRERVTVGTSGSDKEKGLQAAVEALSPSRLAGEHFGFVRDDAQLLTVFVSDEDDCSDFGALDGRDARDCYTAPEELVDPNAVLSKLYGLKAEPSQVTMSGILGLSDSACEDSWPGARYLELVRATGGLSGDICRSDWSDMLFELGLNTVGEQFRFGLSEAAKIETLRVFVDDEPVDAEDWTYDDRDWMLIFDRMAIPPRGSTIRAEYIVAPTTASE